MTPMHNPLTKRDEKTEKLLDGMAAAFSSVIAHLNAIEDRLETLETHLSNLDRGADSLTNPNQPRNPSVSTHKEELTK